MNPEPQTPIPLLSVVIPTVGRATLVTTVDSLLRCRNTDRIEIIVAGQIGDPAVAEDLHRLRACHAGLRHLPVAFETGDSSRKKNAGAAEARADLVAFIDDDVKVGEDWIDRITAPFHDPAVGLVSGPSLVPEDINRMARLAGHALCSWAAGYVADRYRASCSAPHPARWSALIGCNMAFRKSVLTRIGGFRPDFWPGEEMIASFEATRGGHSLVFTPLATLHHYPRSSFGRFCRQIFGYGATRVRLYRAGVECEPSTLVPAFWMVWLVATGLASPFLRVAAIALSASLLVYLVFVAVVAVYKMMETRRADMGLLVFIIPVMHLCYGIGEWVEFLRPNRDLSVEGGAAT